MGVPQTNIKKPLCPITTTTKVRDKVSLKYTSTYHLMSMLSPSSIYMSIIPPTGYPIFKRVYVVNYFLPISSEV